MGGYITMAMIDDTVLLDRWREQSDPEAFAELVQRYAGLVHGTCKRILGDAQDAEDATQECFIKLSQADGKSARALGGWLHRVATNQALDRLKAGRRRAERERTFGEQAPDAVSIDINELQEHIDRVLAELPEALRLPIVLHFLEGVTHEEVARRLGVSRSAVTRRIQRGVETIRKRLDQKGLWTKEEGFTASLALALLSEAPKSLMPKLAKLGLAGSTTMSGSLALPGSFVGRSAWSWPVWAGAGLVGALIVGTVFVQMQNPVQLEDATLIEAQPSQTAPSPRPPDDGQTVVAQAQPEDEQLAETDETTVTAQVQKIGGSTFDLKAVDAEGKSVEGAEILVVRAEWTQPYMLTNTPETTIIEYAGPLYSDDKGMVGLPFDIATLPDKVAVSLHAVVPGQLAGAWLYTGSNRLRNLPPSPTVILMPTRSVEGVVTVPSGYTLDGVSVDVLSVMFADGKRGGFGSGFSLLSLRYAAGVVPDALLKRFSVVPDTAGRFVFEDLPLDGRIYLAATGPGLAEQQFYDFEPHALKSVPFTMEPEGTIEGQAVYATTGLPAQGISITARPQPDGNRMVGVTHTFTAITDPLGRFSIGGLPALRFSVHAQNTNADPLWVTRVEYFEVESGHITDDVTVWIESGAIVEGQVSDEETGDPIAGATIAAVNPGMGGEAVGSSTTQADGRYRIRLPQGPSLLYFARIPETVKYPKDQGRRTVDVAAGVTYIDDVDFQLGQEEDPDKYRVEATVRGRVVDADGEGVEGVRLSYGRRYEYGDSTRNYGQMQLGRSSTDGRFEFTVQAYGEYRFQAGGTAFYVDRGEWTTLEPDETRTLEDFVVAPYTAWLSGALVDTEGGPIPGATVRIGAEDYDGAYPGAQTDRYGRFEFRPIPEGAFSVTAAKAGYKTGNWHVEVNENYEFTLEPGSDPRDDEEPFDE